MRYIIKGTEPQSFTDWKNLENEDWKPTYDQLSGTVKRDIKELLITEQGGICCYCERRLEYDDSHIEHLNPQCNNEDERLDFSNFLCSCQQHLQRGEPLHCGNSKGEQNLPVTPLQYDCETKFTYAADGQILYTDVGSKDTIEVLQLDIDKLTDLRKQAIEPFLIDPITFEEISVEDAKIFADSYLQLNNAQYGEFYTTIKYLFG